MTDHSPQKPIRVAHLITRMIVGGAQENTLYTAALLNKDRYTVELVTGPQTGSEGSLLEEAREHMLPVITLPALVREISPLKDLKAFSQLYRLLRERKYTILHTHSSKAGILGRLAGRLARAPIIIHTVHGWSFNDCMPAWKKTLYIYLERWAARYSNALVVVTNKDIEKGLAARVGKPGQYHLIRSAIPMNTFSPSKVNRAEIRRKLGIPIEAVVIGNVGRFSPQKNPLDWVKIAGLVGKKETEVYFLLVGDGPLRSQVETQLELEGIRSRTIITGLRRDVPELLAAMDLFMLTSLWEGLPRVIPQAMAMGLPVLAYAVDGVAEIISTGVNGYTFQPGEVEKMAEACRALVQDPQSRIKIGAAGQASVVDEFDLEKMIERIEALYARSLQPGQRTRHKSNLSYHR